MDLVVSVSALEHNETIEDITAIAHELERVLKPGGVMLVTLPAAREADWFFKAAYAWCISDPTLRKIFGLLKGTSSNFDEYFPLFEKLRASSEIRKKISWRYIYSPNSGLPWSVRHPKYQPVSVLKLNRRRSQDHPTVKPFPGRLDPLARKPDRPVLLGAHALATSSGLQESG